MYVFFFFLLACPFCQFLLTCANVWVFSRRFSSCTLMLFFLMAWGCVYSRTGLVPRSPRTGTYTRHTRTGHGNTSNTSRTRTPAKQHYKSTSRKPYGKTHTFAHVNKNWRKGHAKKKGRRRKGYTYTFSTNLILILVPILTSPKLKALIF
jgi:hypothetical protein